MHRSYYFFFKADLSLNRAQFKAVPQRQFCRTHPGHSESYMVLGVLELKLKFKVEVQVGSNTRTLMSVLAYKMAFCHT